MSGISIKFLQELLDSRILIVPNTYMESQVNYYFSPPESFTSELQYLTKNLKLLLLRFHKLCNKYHLPNNNMVAFFHEIEMKYKKFCENGVAYAEIKTLL